MDFCRLVLLAYALALSFCGVQQPNKNSLALWRKPFVGVFFPALGVHHALPHYVSALDSSSMVDFVSDVFRKYYNTMADLFLGVIRHHVTSPYINTTSEKQR